MVKKSIQKMIWIRKNSEFIDSMNTDQFAILNEYITEIPRLEHTLSYECKNCGTHNEVKLTGLQDFF